MIHAAQPEVRVAGKGERSRWRKLLDFPNMP